MPNPFESGLEADFTLETERGGLIEEPPFQILVTGDFSGDAVKKPLTDRRPKEIDRDNFEEVMSRIAPRLNLGDLVLDFAELDDFHPDQIFRHLPVFTELRDLRRRLKDESTYNKAAGDVRAWMMSGAPRDETPESTNGDAGGSADQQAADNLLDAILAKPEGGAPKPKSRVSSEISSLIADVVRPHLVAVDENEQKSMLAAVDDATSSLMREILHVRAFQDLEAAWRGLYFLVRRTETSSDLKIFVLDVSKPELLGDLRSASNLKDSALAKVLIETDPDEPWALVCGNYAFEGSKDDVAGLVRVAKVAAAAGAPFVSHMRPDVFGVHSIAAKPDPREWHMSTDFGAGALWATLRGIPEAKFLGMTMPRFLARLPYGADTEPLETFSFEEFADGPEHDSYVWANACFAAATLLAQSYSNYGWEMGRSMMQDLEDLPVHMYKQDGETVYQPCSEVLMTQNAAELLMEYGLMPLVSYKNTDRVKLARVQSIADPVTGLKGRWN